MSYRRVPSLISHHPFRARVAYSNRDRQAVFQRRGDARMGHRTNIPPRGQYPPRLRQETRFTSDPPDFEVVRNRSPDGCTGTCCRNHQPDRSPESTFCYYFGVCAPGSRNVHHIGESHSSQMLRRSFRAGDLPYASICLLHAWSNRVGFHPILSPVFGLRKKAPGQTSCSSLSGSLSLLI